MSNSLKRKLVTTAASALAICTLYSVTESGVKEVQAADTGYQLVWSDEFVGTSLNGDNWTPLIGNGKVHNNPGWGNNELEYYTNSNKNIQVSNGTLKIIAREEVVDSEEGKFNYTSARMVTSGKQSFKYGKIEARMKLPAVKGVWPAFWMMGYNDKGWPYCGEIDIMESWNEAQFAQGAWHWYNDRKPNAELWTMYTVGQMYSAMNDFKGFDKTQWHTYGIIWDTRQIQWTVDDKVFFTQDITPSDMTEAHGEYYFLLNLAVGGNLPGTAPDPGTLPATMEVDYVRVYQKNDGKSTHSSKWAAADQNSVTKHKVVLKNGNKTITNADIYDGGTVIVPTLTKKGYLFKGFYANGKKITSNTRIRSNITAKVKWQKVTVKKAKIKKLTPAKKIAKVKLSVTGGAKGFQVKYGTKSSLKSGKTKTIQGKSITIPKLQSGKKYYFKARAYKLDSKKKKVYGKWSSVKSVTIK